MEKIYTNLCLQINWHTPSSGAVHRMGRKQRALRPFKKKLLRCNVVIVCASPCVILFPRWGLLVLCLPSNVQLFWWLWQTGQGSLHCKLLCKWCSIRGSLLVKATKRLLKPNLHGKILLAIFSSEPLVPQKECSQELRCSTLELEIEEKFAQCKLSISVLTLTMVNITSYLQFTTSYLPQGLSSEVFGGLQLPHTVYMSTGP